MILFRNQLKYQKDLLQIQNVKVMFFARFLGDVNGLVHERFVARGEFVADVVSVKESKVSDSFLYTLSLFIFFILIYEYIPLQFTIPVLSWGWFPGHSQGVFVNGINLNVLGRAGGRFLSGDDSDGLGWL